MKHISQPQKSIYIIIRLGKVFEYEIHGSNLTGCGEVRSPCVGFGSFATASLPSSIVRSKTLLCWPSEIFKTFV